MISYHAPAITKNTAIFYEARSILAVSVGATSGILGLQGTSGIALYVIVSLVFSALVAVATTKSPPFPSTMTTMTSGVSGGLMTFLLFWTLFFNLVYGY
mmetsp:Transcript_16065/g.50213  ORF Transcript_16065/g.50213 Transcript_16065/m.50213 type:complete len:99 (-) Transcript_16065:1582-1878(-)